MPRPVSIRARLALWYALAVAVSLAVFAGAVYIAMWRTLESSLDAKIDEGATFFGQRLRYQFGEGEETGYAVEALARKSPFQSLSLEVYGPDGRVLAGSSDVVLTPPAPRIPWDAVPEVGGGFYRARVDADVFGEAGADLAAVRVLHPQGGAYTIVTYGRRDDVASALETLVTLFAALAPALLALSAGLGYALAGRALAPVVTMAAQARRMGADRLTDRLAAPNPSDELGQLAATFNELLDRIEASLGRMRQFVADASHELRTPVAIIRGEADVALTPPTSAAESTASLEVIRDESARLTRLVDDMFLLARADARRVEVLRTEEVSIRDLVARCARSAARLGEEHGVRVEVGALPDARVACLGDAARLEQLVLNLLDNATKYAGAGHTARVKATVTDGVQPVVRIVVSDDGPGIPEQLREAVFERFVCVDKARTRRKGGSGLGLPIARCIAEAHDGSLVLAAADPNGCTFVVTLPALQLPAPEGDPAPAFIESSSGSR
jgi:signal transduction histidine kinase